MKQESWGKNRESDLKTESHHITYRVEEELFIFAALFFFFSLGAFLSFL